MKRLFRVAATSLAAVALLVLRSDGSRADARSATVVGRVVRETPMGPAPVVGVRVTLSHRTYGRSEPSYTGTAGWYTFFNIPSGDFTLEVWLNEARAEPLRMALHVPDADRFTATTVTVR